MESGNEKYITISAYLFAHLLSGLLVKYVLYDNGITVANLLLIVGVTFVRLFLLKEHSSRLQEGATLILFVLFDKSLLDFGNVLLLLGVGCIREYFNRATVQDVLYKESVSLACGLTFSLMGWYSAGRISIIYALIIFYHQTALMAVNFNVCTFFCEFIEHLKKLIRRERKP